MHADELAARLARALIIHIPPRRRGLRLAALTEHSFGAPKRPMRGRHQSGYAITCELTDPVLRSLYYRGTYEPHITARISEALEPGDTFVDVGANVGHFTFLAAQIVGPAGHVHAIEASPETAGKLQRDVTANGLDSRVTVHNVAALDRADVVTIADVGKAYLRHIETDGDGVQVDAVRLDELLGGEHPSVIKVDIEGADLRALQGMRGLFDDPRPRLVVVEAEDRNLVRFDDSVEALCVYMNELGYAAETVNDDYHADAIAFTPTV